MKISGMSIHMTVKKEGNQVRGPCRMTGREESIVCKSVDHSVRLPYNLEKRQIAGDRVHSPVSIVKDIDETSPVLYQALATAERLSEVKIAWYMVNENGMQKPYFTTTLKNALIVGLRPSKYPGRYTEEVTLGYEKIMWTYENGGISSADSLRQPAGT